LQVASNDEVSSAARQIAFVLPLLLTLAPPPKSAAGDKPKCRNVEECQEASFRREQEQCELADANAVPTSRTANGVRYRDFQEGTGAVAKVGDDVTVYFKVLKIGKRSYDGLSGEGTVVFLQGYGLEDDEKKPRR
jgi:hypothetical protein